MLHADASQLRFLAQRFSDAASDFQYKASRIEAWAHSLTATWTGTASESFVLQAEFVAGEFRKQVSTCQKIGTTLQTLASRVEHIEHKKQDLQRLQHERQTLQYSADPIHDAKIVYLDGRISLLEGDIWTESQYADQAASMTFHGIQVADNLHHLWDELVQGAKFVVALHEEIIIPAIGVALKDIEEHPDKYLKGFCDLVGDAVLEFLAIPEIMGEWNTLTDPKSSWSDRVEAGAYLITNVGTDLLMLVGVGEEIRGAELLAKAGEKFGTTMRNVQQSKTYKALFETDGSKFFKKLSNGKTLIRGLNVGPRLAPAGAPLESAGEGRTLTEWYSQAKDTVYRFAGNLSEKIRAYRGADLAEVEQKYLADERLIVEMPFKGKGAPGTNSQGWIRNDKYYFRELLERHPEYFDEDNTIKILDGIVPENNKHFYKHFPQYDLPELHDNPLVHHHIGGGGQAVAVPKELHKGFGGIHNIEKKFGIWNRDQEYSDLLQKFIDRIKAGGIFP